MNDTQTSGVYVRSYVLCRDLKNAATLTIQIGAAGVAPASDNPEFEGTYVLVSAPVTESGGRLVITPTWQVSGSTAPAWGTVA